MAPPTHEKKVKLNGLMIIPEAKKARLGWGRGLGKGAPGGSELGPRKTM